MVQINRAWFAKIAIVCVHVLFVCLFVFLFVVLLVPNIKFRPFLGNLSQSVRVIHVSCILRFLCERLTALVPFFAQVRSDVNVGFVASTDPFAHFVTSLQTRSVISVGALD